MLNKNTFKYKMIAIDLDGTLIKTNRTVSDYTVNMLNSFVKSGVIVVPATARPLRSVKKFLPRLEFNAAVCHNGAIVCSEGKMIMHNGIENPVEIIKLADKTFPNRKISAEVNDLLYANFDAALLFHDGEFTTTSDFSEIENEIADKIIIESDSLDEIEQLNNVIPQSLYAQLSANIIAMIMNKKATKLGGVKCLADYYGIGFDEIIAFGDDYGDIELLKACGCGVAVENALDEVKAVSDFICKSNDEDGVAHFLATLFDI